MQKSSQQEGQALAETAIVFPIIIIMILAILQFTILISCQLAVNFAAYKAARAILLSSNTSKYFGYGNANSIVKDARTAVTGTLSIFYPGIGLGWLMPPSVKLYRHEGQAQYGRSANEITEDSIPQPPNQTLWVIVRSEVIIVIPLMRSIFGKAFGRIGLSSVKAACLVDTPSQP